MKKLATPRAALSGLLHTAAPIIMMAPTVQERITALETKRDEILAAAQKIIDDLADGDDLSDEQTDAITASTTEVEGIDKQIAAFKKVLPVGNGRRTAPEPKVNGKTALVPAQVRDNPRHNFTNMGEFAQGVRLVAIGQHDHDSAKKIMAAATTYGNETAGADGGFLVPPEFSRQLWQKVEAEDNLMNLCTPLTPAGNSMSIPKDETTPWGTAGIRVFWEGEANAMTPSKPVFESSTFRLFKLTALVPASDELLEDAPGYESFIQAKVPGIMSHTINDKIIAGIGTGMPLGILNSPSLISVAKETSQPADTVWMANVNKMWSRMYSPWRRNAVWLINQDVEPQLEAMAFAPQSVVPTAASAPVYMPPGGLSEAPYARLKGRPVMPIQACKTIGDQGDILLVDLRQYWLLKKASGIKTDTSVHLYFDQAVTAFRFIFRMNGQPAWSAAITPQNGSNTLSWAVALDAR